MHMDVLSRTKVDLVLFGNVMILLFILEISHPLLANRKLIEWQF
jgi:hypothetical protein